MKSILCIGAGVALVWLAVGCGEGVAWQDSRDERDPLFQQAREKKNAQDNDGAIKLYNEALDNKPRLARAHLEVGLLYAKREDFVRAIYHYQRYLELRPAAEKRDLVTSLIREAQLCYAASLPNRPPGAIEEIALLKKEIASLRAQRLNSNVQPKIVSAVAGFANVPRALPSPQPIAAQPAVRTHIVQRGETLAAIAAQEYKNRSNWRKIFDANRDSLATPESIRAGQTLVIPP